MPFIYNYDLEDFGKDVRIPDEDTTESTFYYNETVERRGDGLMSGIGSLFKSGVDLVKGNKDLIIEGAKATAALGSTINKVVDAVKTDKQLKELELIKKIQDEKKQKSVSSNTKKKLEEIVNKDQIGDGFSKF